MQLLKNDSLRKTKLYQWVAKFYQKLLRKVLLFVLAFIFTAIWELNFIPVVLSKADAGDIHNPIEIYKNHLNPQDLLEEAKKLYDKEKYVEAISVLKQAAVIFQTQNNSIKHSIALSNIASAYKQLAEYDMALKYISQSREILKIKSIDENNAEKLKIFAQILDIQANLQLILGKPTSAVENWKQAAAIYQQQNLQQEKIRSLINQTIALQADGRYQLALKILTDLLANLHQQPASILKVTALRSFGDAQLYLGEIDASLKTLQQSYDIALKIKSAPQIAETLLSLGNALFAKANQSRSPLQNTTLFNKTAPLVYVGKQISSESRKLYQQAVNIYEQTIAASTSPIIQAKAQLNVISLLIELKEFQRAGELAFQLQSNINQLPVSETSVKAKIKLGENLFLLKQASAGNAPAWENIAKILATAIKQAEALENTRLQAYGIGTLGSIYLQTNHLADAQQLTQKAVDLALKIEAKDIAYLWQWQLGYIHKLQENIPQAIENYSQAVNNLNNLRGDLLVLKPDIQFSFRDNVEPVYRQLVDLLLQPSKSQITQVKSDNSVNANIINNNINKARDVIEALQLREIENYFQEVCLQAKPEIVDTVVDKKDTTAAVIYPIILQNRLEIILKLPLQNKLNHYTTFVKAEVLENTIEKLQNSLRQPEQRNKVKELSAQLYKWTIQPLEADLQAKNIQTLVFVLDGNLRNIPMAVLYDNQTQETEAKYLIEKYAITLTPGLQMLEPKPLENTELNILMAGVSEKRLIGNREFNPLQNILVELKTIQSQIPRSKKLLNQSFTEKNLEKQINSAKYTVVHIATHGNFSSNLEETYILTWNKLLKVKDFDKLFQVNTNVDARTIELLVLSACETASGDKKASLGLSGIAVRAGARSTLATLWAVEDESTALLMSQFYQQLQQNKLNKAKALQQAQINLLKNDELPLTWAPYVLIGNWL
ncbi:MAG: CHAT domain-containing protein [Rivularia sp. (in: Bacteria)]|nr:CHAT domain-containing protein [Rivularia sp. MS3]